MIRSAPRGKDSRTHDPDPVPPAQQRSPHPPAGLRRLPGPAGRGGRAGAHRPRQRLPADRHRRRVRQRGGRRQGARRVRACRATSCSSRPSCGTPTRATTRRCAPSTRAWTSSASTCLDLYLIHWPRPKRDQYVETLEGARASSTRTAGSARSASPTSPRPTSTGWRTRPTSCRRSTRSSCTRGCRRTSCGPTTTSTASSPRRGARSARAQGLLDDPRIEAIAESYGKTPAQLVLRWHVELGNVVIPKSVTPGPHRREHRHLRLRAGPDDDRDALTAYDGVGRIGPDPEDADFDQ